MGSRFREIADKGKIRVAGLMSGTSVDGVDVAVVDVSRRKVQLRAFETFAYPPALRKRILGLCRPESARLEDICHYNFVLGEVFADAVIKLCSKSGMAPGSIDLIGSHGQTIYHDPRGRRYGRRAIRSTLQGEGAPLVPFADYILFGHNRITRAVQNIGGIANVTLLPGGGVLGEVTAFDTGPGNMVIDGIIRLATGGKRNFLCSAACSDIRFCDGLHRNPRVVKSSALSSPSGSIGKRPTKGCRMLISSRL
jgi:anhydro-N-acetylmuramic acid kinase